MPARTYEGFVLGSPLEPGGGGGGVAPTVANTIFGVSALNNAIRAITFGTNVAAGKLLVIGVAGFHTNHAPTVYTAAMLTQTGGTATLGTIVLDKTTNRTTTVDDSTSLGLFSVPVTGSGSLTLTMDVSGASAGDSNFLVVLGCELTFADVSGTRVNGSNSSNATTGVSASTDNVATGGAGIIFGLIAPGDPFGTQTLTDDPSFTVLSKQTDDSQLNHTFGYRSVTVDTTDAYDSTIGVSSSWVAAAVAYKSSTP